MPRSKQNLRLSNELIRDNDKKFGAHFARVTGNVNVLIADQKPHPGITFLKFPDHLTCLLGDPHPIWVGCTARKMHTARARLDVLVRQPIRINSSIVENTCLTTAQTICSRIQFI